MLHEEALFRGILEVHRGPTFCNNIKIPYTPRIVGLKLN
jgi:hypothetical protein